MFRNAILRLFLCLIWRHWLLSYREWNSIGFARAGSSLFVAAGKREMTTYSSTPKTTHFPSDWVQISDGEFPRFKLTDSLKGEGSLSRALYQFGAIGAWIINDFHDLALACKFGHKPCATRSQVFLAEYILSLVEIAIQEGTESCTDRETIFHSDSPICT